MLEYQRSSPVSVTNRLPLPARVPVLAGRLS
jgi:hypothetical protein